MNSRTRAVALRYMFIMEHIAPYSKGPLKDCTSDPAKYAFSNKSLIIPKSNNLKFVHSFQQKQNCILPSPKFLQKSNKILNMAWQLRFYIWKPFTLYAASPGSWFNPVAEIRQSRDHLISSMKSVTIYHSGCGVSEVVADGLEPVCSISGHHNATNFCTCHDSTAVVPCAKSCSDFARICGHN